MKSLRQQCAEAIELSDNPRATEQVRRAALESACRLQIAIWQAEHEPWVKKFCEQVERQIV